MATGTAELRQALMRNGGALAGVALFSATINLLMLTGPLFMLQVYDRALASRFRTPSAGAKRHLNIAQTAPDTGRRLFASRTYAMREE